MNVFDLRSRLTSDYSAFVRSFMSIRDQRIFEKVDTELSAGLLWPEPLIQLNPSFMPGETVDELVADNVLHEECSRIFRRNKGEDNGSNPRFIVTSLRGDAQTCTSRS